MSGKSVLKDWLIPVLGVFLLFELDLVIGYIAIKFLGMPETFIIRQKPERGGEWIKNAPTYYYVYAGLILFSLQCAIIGAYLLIKGARNAEP
jgi:hypothetical protein